MRTPGRIAADWVVDDPGRDSLTKQVDLAFYTLMVNAGCVLMLIALITLLVYWTIQ